MASFSKPSCSRREVDEAGKIIATTSPQDLEAVPRRDQALDILSDWRSAHGWPLNSMQTTLRGRAKRVAHEDLIAVVQRLKRLPSIERKLRQTYLKLTQIQDIGGCRAIVPSIAAVDELDEIYSADRDSSRVQSDHWKRNDYIQEPKSDGYRSIHHVFEYHTNREERKGHNGMRIEIQLRSVLQHAWATAVETVSAFQGEGLKWGRGDPRWLRFFELMSTAIARREGRPAVPDTPDDGATLVEKVRALDEELGILDALSGRFAALREVGGGNDVRNPALYLLVLNARDRTFHVTPFPKAQRPEAEEMYKQQERATEDDDKIDIVLVGADSLAELKKGYPNYRADTRAFLTITREVIKGRG